MTNAEKAELAKHLAYNCVRNSPLEDIHEDRISDAEMKDLMIYITDALYTALIDPGYFRDTVPAYWQQPKHLRERNFNAD